MTHNKSKFIEIFNSKAQYNLSDVILVDHPDGLINVFFEGKKVFTTYSIFKACSKAYVLMSK